MSDDTKLYISVESKGDRLVVDGSMSLWRELVDSFGRVPAERQPSGQNSPGPDRLLAEALS